MKISIVTTATNPLKNNYQIFFSCVNSFSKIADEIIVVSGGTTDGSFQSELLKKDTSKKMVIVENSKTLWDYKNDFSGNQINTMINEGLSKATGDWVFVVWSDYILVSQSKDEVVNELEQYKDESWLRYKRKTNFLGKEIIDTRISAVINLNWIDKNLFTRKIYGLDSKNKTLYDYPINPILGYKEYTKDKKDQYNIFIGEELESDNFVIDSMHVEKFDHFFYDIQQVLDQKYIFNKNFQSRQKGLALLKPEQILSIQFAVKGVYKDSFFYIDKDRLMSENRHLPNLLPLIEKFYHKEMIGSLRTIAVNNKFRNLSYRSINFKTKILSKIRSKYLRFRGLKGILDYADIRPISDLDNATPIDLEEIWRNQDIYYETKN